MGKAQEAVRKALAAEVAIRRAIRKITSDEATPKQPPKIKPTPVLVQKIWINGKKITFNLDSSSKNSLDRANSAKQPKPRAKYKKEVCGVINRQTFVSHGTITTDDGKKRSFNFHMANEKISHSPISSGGHAKRAVLR